MARLFISKEKNREDSFLYRLIAKFMVSNDRAMQPLYDADEKQLALLGGSENIERRIAEAWSQLPNWEKFDIYYEPNYFALGRGKGCYIILFRYMRPEGAKEFARLFNVADSKGELEHCEFRTSSCSEDEVGTQMQLKQFRNTVFCIIDG